jgi:hypothetical protein
VSGDGVGPAAHEAAVIGVVESAIYVGAAWRFEVALADGQKLRGMCAENGKRVPVRGDQVSARWAIADAQVMSGG